MASFRDLIKYYEDYKITVIFSIGIAGLFEIIDLTVPYLIGQILNIISSQKVDNFTNNLIEKTAFLFPYLKDFTTLSLTILVMLIFIITVVRAPIQPWIASWFHWEVALKSRKENRQ